MPSLHLDADEGIAGSSLVGERRMAHVMEGSEWLGAPGTNQRGPQVGPHDLARIKGGPEFGMTEDALVLAIELRASVVIRKEFDGARPELDQPAGCPTLRGRHPPGNESFPDVEPAV